MRRVLKGLVCVGVPTPLRRRLFRPRLWVLGEISRPDSPYSLDGFDRLHCIFFHIPKTGGLSVSEALFGNRGAGHISVQEAQLLFGTRAFRDYFKFTFVRNPFDRLVSAYEYLVRGALGHTISPWIAQHILPYEGFDDFVRRGLRDGAVRTDLHFRGQSTYVTDSRGRTCVDFIGRFEQLEEDFSRVAERVGQAAELPHRNVSERRADYRSYYSPRAKAIAEDFYAEDLRRFGYEF